MSDTAHDLNELFSKPFLTDKDVAKILSVSPSWVRKQRHLRHTGESHSLTIDEVRVGSSPRYRANDFKTWLESLSQ